MTVLMVGMRFDNTRGPNFSSEMSFSFPVWCCSHDWFDLFFCGPVARYSLNWKQLAEEEAPPPAAFSSITGIFFSLFAFAFSWQALFWKGRTTCWCVAQLFTCHNVKWNFQSLCFFYFKKNNGCSSCTDSWDEHLQCTVLLNQPPSQLPWQCS